MISTNDFPYCIAAFIGIGVGAILSANARPQIRAYALNEPITASLMMIMTGMWCVISSLLYKAYDTVRSHSRRVDTDESSKVQESEMLILMTAMDPGSSSERERPPVVKTAAAREDVSPLGAPYDAVMRRLQVRNNLLVNIYLVACGVFFSIFPIASLDIQSFGYFTASVLLLACWDCWSRFSQVPICFESSMVKTVHTRSQQMEWVVLLLLVAFVVLLLVVNPTQAESDELAVEAIVVHVGAAVAPFLICMAPAEHHYIIAFETSVPMACLVALGVLYTMSPIAPYMTKLHDMHQMWPYFLIMPVLIPIVVVSLMHMIRKGVVIVFCGTLCLWSLVFLCTEYTTLKPSAAVWAMISVVVAAVAVFVGLERYGRRHIISHAGYTTKHSHSLSQLNVAEDHCFCVTDAENDDDCDADDKDEEVGKAKFSEVRAGASAQDME